MQLNDLRKKVIYQNTLDVWISVCEEKKLPWNKIENYKKFIEYLKEQKISMKEFPLCVSESNSSSPEKIEFAELLSETKDPASSTYTIKLNDSTLSILRKFSIG